MRQPNLPLFGESHRDSKKRIPPPNHPPHLSLSGGLQSGLPATHPRGSTAFEGQRRTPAVPDRTYYGAPLCPRMQPRVPRISCLHPNRLHPNPHWNTLGHTLLAWCCAGKGTSGALDLSLLGCVMQSGSPLLTRSESPAPSRLLYPEGVCRNAHAAPSGGGGPPVATRWAAPPLADCRTVHFPPDCPHLAVLSSPHLRPDDPPHPPASALSRELAAPPRPLGGGGGNLPLRRAGPRPRSLAAAQCTSL